MWYEQYQFIDHDVASTYLPQRAASSSGGDDDDDDDVPLAQHAASISPNSALPPSVGPRVHASTVPLVTKPASSSDSLHAAPGSVGAAARTDATDIKGSHEQRGDGSGSADQDGATCPDGGDSSENPSDVPIGNVSKTLLAFEDSVEMAHVVTGFSQRLRKWRTDVRNCRTHQDLGALMRVFRNQMRESNLSESRWYFAPEWRKDGVRLRAWLRATRDASSARALSMLLNELKASYSPEGVKPAAPPRASKCKSSEDDDDEVMILGTRKAAFTKAARMPTGVTPAAAAPTADASSDDSSDEDIVVRKKRRIDSTQKQSRLLKGGQHKAKRTASMKLSVPGPWEGSAPWEDLHDLRMTLGRKVKVFWGDDRRWFRGIITNINEQNHKVFISYDDGDVKWHAMWEECYEFVDSAPVRTQAKADAAKPTGESARVPKRKDATRPVTSEKRKASASGDSQPSPSQGAGSSVVQVDLTADADTEDEEPLAKRAKYAKRDHGPHGTRHQREEKKRVRRDSTRDKSQGLQMLGSSQGREDVASHRAPHAKPEDKQHASCGVGQEVSAPYFLGGDPTRCTCAAMAALPSSERQPCGDKRCAQYKYYDSMKHWADMRGLGSVHHGMVKFELTDGMVCNDVSGGKESVVDHGWLALDASAGDRSFTLREPVSWPISSVLDILSTELKPVERVTVLSVDASGTRITLSAPLAHHYRGAADGDGHKAACVQLVQVERLIALFGGARVHKDGRVEALCQWCVRAADKQAPPWTQTPLHASLKALGADHKYAQEPPRSLVYRIGGTDSMSWVNDWSNAVSILGRCRCVQLPTNKIIRACEKAQRLQDAWLNFFYDSACAVGNGQALETPKQLSGSAHQEGAGNSSSDDNEVPSP